MSFHQKSRMAFITLRISTYTIGPVTNTASTLGPAYNEQFDS